MMRQFGIGVGLLLAMAATLDAQLRPVRPGVGGEAPKSMTLDEALTKIKSKDTRLTAVIALADHGVKAAPAIDDLIDALRDANEDLRLNAASRSARSASRRSDRSPNC